jgi:transcriptional repressor NrdR
MPGISLSNVLMIKYSHNTIPNKSQGHSMKCPFCGYTESRVKDSRDIGDVIHRRRECEQCKARFSTYERVEKFHLMVIKRDQRREPFSREKLSIGLRKACEKRPLPAGEIENAVEDIEQELYRFGKQEIPSSVIGELVMDRLRLMDKIAYIRFASVYRSFGDVETMFDEIQKLLNREKLDGNTLNYAPISDNQNTHCQE